MTADPRALARQRALEARDQLLKCIESTDLHHAQRKALVTRVEALWSAASLAMSMGEGAVYPSLMDQACRKDRP